MYDYGKRDGDSEKSQGTWSLLVVDTASQDVGRLVHWGLVTGYQKSSNTVTGNANPDMAIPDADPQGIVSGIQIQQSGTVKDVAVGIDIKRTYIGDLRVDLLSPSGQVVRLHDQAGGAADNLKRSYDTTATPDLGDCLGLSMEGNGSSRYVILRAWIPVPSFPGRFGLSIERLKNP